VLSCNAVFFGGVTFSYIFVCLLLLYTAVSCCGNSIPYHDQTAATQQITKMCIISGKEHE